jgi:hypothetical protein
MAIVHRSDYPAVDYYTEPVIGDCRLVGLLLSFVLMGLVLSTFIDPSGVDERRHRVERTTRARVLRAPCRILARRKAA